MDPQLVKQILDARARVTDRGRPQTVAAARQQGRLTARERLNALLDPGSLVEYGPLAGSSTVPDADHGADGLVGGAGLVAGCPVVAASYDATLAAGTQSDRNQRKLARLIYLANHHRWPLVCFADGDGARPDDPPAGPPIVVAPRGRWGLLDGLAELSGWAPTVAIVSGRALDGHAALALLSDFVVATAGSALGSWGHERGDEPVLRPVDDFAAAGHVDQLVDDDAQAIEVVRRYLTFYLKEPSQGSTSPGYAGIGDLIPDNRRRPYDMSRVIEAFADADSVLELGTHWGRSMLTCLGRLDGRSVGIFANQPQSHLGGAIDAQAADKAARFIELCDAYGYPLISFIDNPGYMVGPQAERDGIARHHARPLSALHHRRVPLCSVQLRKAYGLGPFAMSGWGSSQLSPELRLAWPTVESGGMSLEGAASLVKRKEMRAATSREEALAIRDAYAESMREAASGLRAARAYAFDDVILPTETRERISALLARLPRALATRRRCPIDPH